MEGLERVGEGVGDKYDQNALYKFMKFLNNKNIILKFKIIII